MWSTAISLTDKQLLQYVAMTTRTECKLRSAAVREGEWVLRDPAFQD
jgi:hypothetical protein